MTFNVEVFGSGEKKLMIVASNHCMKKSAIFPLKKILLEFNPDISLVEGNFNLAYYSNEDQAIDFGGEMGFISYLCNENKIKLISNDPDFHDDISFIERKYGKDFSFLYFFLRKKSFMIDNSQTFSDVEILDYVKKDSNWKNFDYSINNINKIFKNLFKEDIKERSYQDFFNPTLNINIFNDATVKLNNFRDDFMIGVLRESIKSFNRIFLIKGRHHIDVNRDKILSTLK